MATVLPSSGRGSKVGIARNLFVSLPWLIFAAVVLWMFWAYGDPDMPQVVGIPGVFQIPVVRPALWIGFISLSFLGAMLRLLIGSWFPQLRFDFSKQPLVTYDVRTGTVLDVQRFDFSNAVNNFVWNRFIAFFSTWFAWALLELVVQVVFLARTTMAVATGQPLPRRVWPERATREHAILSYAAVAAAVGLFSLSIMRLQALDAQSVASQTAAPAVAQSATSVVLESSPAGRNELPATTLAQPVVATCGQAVVFEVNALNLREAPTTNAATLASVARGEAVELFCEPTVLAEDIEWQQVRYGDVEGWMSRRYLQP